MAEKKGPSLFREAMKELKKTREKVNSSEHLPEVSDPDKANLKTFIQSIAEHMPQDIDQEKVKENLSKLREAIAKKLENSETEVVEEEPTEE